MPLVLNVQKYFYFSDARKLFKAWQWAGLTISENLSNMRKIEQNSTKRFKDFCLVN